MGLVKKFELPFFDCTQAREQLRFTLLEFGFRYFVELESHLKLKQLLLDDRVVIQFLISHLLDLTQDEFETGNRGKQNVVY